MRCRATTGLGGREGGLTFAGAIRRCMRWHSRRWPLQSFAELRVLLIRLLPTGWSFSIEGSLSDLARCTRTYTPDHAAPVRDNCHVKLVRRGAEPRRLSIQRRLEQARPCSSPRGRQHPGELRGSGSQRLGGRQFPTHLGRGGAAARAHTSLTRLTHTTAE